MQWNAAPEARGRLRGPRKFDWEKRIPAAMGIAGAAGGAFLGFLVGLNPLVAVLLGIVGGVLGYLAGIPIELFVRLYRGAW